MANFSEFSRYSFGIVVKNRDGVDFLVLRKPLEIEEDETDTFVTITKELITRPDLVSTYSYGFPDLWWAIYEFNNIRDPFFDLKEGQTIKVPGLDKVIAAIQQLDQT